MSVYLNTLSGEVKERYLEKMKFVDNIDPYDCGESTFRREVALFPNINHSDIVNYFIYKTSAYTEKQFKAFKSLDSFKYYKCGWVRDILVRKFGENVLVLGKVMHSQRINDPHLQPWFVAKEDGKVLCGHCTCIAGLGESCSHLGAVMYAIQHAKVFEEETSVTGVRAYWTVPTDNPVEVMPWNQVLTKREMVKAPKRSYPESTPEERMNFLRNIRDNMGITSGVMKVTPPLCYEIVAEEMNPLAILYKEEHKSLTIEELRAKAMSLVLEVTPEICKRVEEVTKKQSASRLWFAHRTGRITASKFKHACCTTIEKPAISTVKTICYPYEMKFTSKQTSYGCEHEKVALEAYIATTSGSHENFLSGTTGFILSPTYPHFGASPDAIISCDCCGHGCVEIKCPFCAKDTSVEEVLPTYIQKGTDYLKLKQNHMYYYQVQMQMAIANKEYCDFVVWSANDIYVERIPFNAEFWEAESSKATRFWSNVIVPELLGKFYTRQSIPPTPTSDPQPSTSSADVPLQPRKWCICRKPDDGTKMIQCDNPTCPLEWFHMRCLNFKRARKSWFCDTCKSSSSK